MLVESRFIRLTGGLRLGATIAVGIAAAIGGPTMAQERTGPVNFFLLNNGPGETFDVLEWLRAVNVLSFRGFKDSISLSTNDPGKVVRMLDDAAAADPRETVIVLTEYQIDTADTAAFAGEIKSIDELLAGIPDMAGSAVFVDTPLCRVMQPPLKPTEQAPTGYVITSTDPAARFDCYSRAAEVHLRRSEGWDLDVDGNRTVAVDPTAERAQEIMPPAMSVGWLLADTADPQRRTRRDSNVFAPGDEIVIRTTLHYIRKRGAGYPGARFEIELDIEVRATDGTLIERREDVHRYEGEVRHRVPVDSDYFANWIFAGIRLHDPGAYKVVFLLTDRMAPVDKQIPVPIEVDVTVE